MIEKEKRIIKKKRSPEEIEEILEQQDSFERFTFGIVIIVLMVIAEIFIVFTSG